MFNIRTIFNWFVFAMIASFIIAVLACFDKDQVVALVLITYSHTFLVHMAERDYFKSRLKKYQKALDKATEIIRSAEPENDNAYEK